MRPLPAQAFALAWLTLIPALILGTILGDTVFAAPTQPRPVPSPVTHRTIPSIAHLSHAMGARPDLSAFAALVLRSAPWPISIDLRPEIPSIPNTLIPVIAHLEPVHHRQTINILTEVSTAQAPNPKSASGRSGIYSTDNHPNPQNGASYTSMDQAIENCMVERSPSLPLSFAPEIGVVRLFAKPSFRGEVAVERRCGCVALQSPMVIKSFVGSRNHSFAFYTNSDCGGEPHYQRYRQHYDMETNVHTLSVRIIQGVLPPIPFPG